MPIDWNSAVLTPSFGVFAEPVTYTRAGGATFSISGVFDAGFVEADPINMPGVLTSEPVLGIQLSQFPSGYDPLNAQQDTFTVLSNGKTYVVRSGQPDSHGWAMLEANLASSS